jgi:hypothetical protein
MHFWFDAVGHSLGSSFEPVSLPYERNGRFIAGISSARVSQTGRERRFPMFAQSRRWISCAYR